MNCPKCIGRLQEHIIDGTFPVQVCFTCHGIWFDKDELEGVIKDGNKALSDDIEVDPDLEEPEDIKDLLKEFSDKVAQCPKCQDTTMTKKNYSGVLADVCPKCGGIWLDSGEVFKVRHHEWKDFFRFAPYFFYLFKKNLTHPFGMGAKDKPLD